MMKSIAPDVCSTLLYREDKVLVLFVTDRVRERGRVTSDIVCKVGRTLYAIRSTVLRCRVNALYIIMLPLLLPAGYTA